MMAEDADLLEDLKKLKRSTKNVSISAQNSLAVVTLLGEGDENEDGTSAGFTSKHVDAEAERAAKSIGGAITNSKMQSYYKAFSNKQTGVVQQPNPATKAIFLNSNPYSNYKPLPD